MVLGQRYSSSTPSYVMGGLFVFFLGIVYFVTFHHSQVLEEQAMAMGETPALQPEHGKARGCLESGSKNCFQVKKNQGSSSRGNEDFGPGGVIHMKEEDLPDHLKFKIQQLRMKHEDEVIAAKLRSQQQGGGSQQLIGKDLIHDILGVELNFTYNIAINRKTDQFGNVIKLNDAEKVMLVEKQLLSEYVTNPPTSETPTVPPQILSLEDGTKVDLGPLLGNDHHRISEKIVSLPETKRKFLKDPFSVYRPPYWFRKGMVEADHFTSTYNRPNQCKLPKHGPPTIIGGVGDSGTRGMRLLVEKVASFDMCPKERCNEAGDNFFTLWALGGQIMRAGKGVIDFTEETVGWDVWQASYMMLCTSANLTMGLEQKSDVLEGRWGWKTPRSVFFMPLYKAIFSTLRFIHVVRDGRDLALGDNQSQFRSLCSSFLPVTKCSRDPRNALLFWGVVTNKVYDYGHEVMGKSSYYAIRIETVTTSNPKAKNEIRKLMDFLEIEIQADHEPLIEAAWKSGAEHEHSYEGRKYSKEKRQKFIQAFGDISQKELIRFGYKIDDWGVAENPPDLNAY